MQKISLTTLCTATMLGISSLANAADPTSSTVAAAKNMPEESMVVLEGTIAPGETAETYVLTDSTGSIDIVVDEEDMQGMNLNADTVVIVEGEIDQNGDNMEIDVDEITLAQ